MFDLRNEIRDRAAHGVSLEEIESELIAPARALDDEQRDSLWLYAWNVCSSGPYHATSSETRERLLTTV